METTTKRRKSVRLTPAEFKSFKKYVKDHITQLDAAMEIGITRPTLERMLVMGQGSPETIGKIRQVINQQPA